MLVEIEALRNVCYGVCGDGKLLIYKALLRGQVQGVGFRPFVYRLARQLGLGGQVRNSVRGVEVELVGEAASIARFRERCEQELPPLAKIDHWQVIAEDPWASTQRPEFRIESSEAQFAERSRVTIDAATCEDCVRELFDPEDPRFRHALINCTNCGPRYSILLELPYDRPRTTMAGFPMCEDCARQYKDPGDRRFHAQPLCCPSCGPQLRFVSQRAGEMQDPTEASAECLRESGWIAMKGLGGYHLVACADDEQAVGGLRNLKARRHKPFAVLYRDLEAASRHAQISEAGAKLLESPVSPILLAPLRKKGEAELAASVIAGTDRVGVLLPSTPMQHLLARAVARPLVMTSANHSHEPLYADDEELLAKLAPECHGVLLHDRRIERAIDDSIFIDTGAEPLPIRRARGLAPTPLPLPVAVDAPGLAVGGDLKNSIALVRGQEVLMSQHIGDLSHPRAYERFLMTIEDLERLFDLTPQWVACDLHPSYTSSRHARRLAKEQRLPLYEVQHHHAHLAALAAERGVTGPLLGLACDGVGHGTDGTAWGGELLRVSGAECQRLATMRPLRLPGGDAATRETWRCALSLLDDALGPAARTHPLAESLCPDERKRHAIFRMLDEGLSCPPSHGLGRLFDATASLLGLCQERMYEAQTGLLLEAAARRSKLAKLPKDAATICFMGAAKTPSGLLEIDSRQWARFAVDSLESHMALFDLAWIFHASLAQSLADCAANFSEAERHDLLGLTGGVFCNTLLTERIQVEVLSRGMQTLTHRLVPPGDGGLAYGQASVAAVRRHAGTLPESKTP